MVWCIITLKVYVRCNIKDLIMTAIFIQDIHSRKDFQKPYTSADDERLKVCVL